MKKQIFVVHGGSSYSKRENFLIQLREGTVHNPHGDKPKRWRESLRDELGLGYEVFTPQMPNSENADYEEWSIWFERHFEYLKDDIVLVGWSLGGMFLVKYMLENSLPFIVSKLILIAAPCGEYFDESGEDCGTFQFTPGKVSKLSTKVKDIQIWHSEDDFVVPYKHALEFMSHLPGAKLVSFEDRNHFLQEEFPELVEVIKGLG